MDTVLGGWPEGAVAIQLANELRVGLSSWCGNGEASSTRAAAEGEVVAANLKLAQADNVALGAATTSVLWADRKLHARDGLMVSHRLSRKLW